MFAIDSYTHYNVYLNCIKKEEFIMIKIKELNIRILLYIGDYEEAFKIYLLKTTSLKDAREIGKALKKYHSADYAELEIIA